MTRLPMPADTRQNRLLASLPEADLARVKRNLKPVFLIVGEALYEVGCILECAYFPATAIASVEYVLADGKSAEVAIVGSEGIVGIALFMGGESRLTLTAQTVICNRHHTVDQQLCRWLLLSLDRSPYSAVITTHEHIANMLGVRRESVTQAAGNLQRLGLVRNTRGQVTVIDHAGLELRSCEAIAS